MTVTRSRSTATIMILAVVGVIAGAFVGGLANGLVLVAGSRLVPPPAGVNPNELESIRAAIATYSVPQLVVPFMAHAVGAFVGGALAWLLAGGRRAGMISAFIVGTVFLGAGIAMVVLIPEAPRWFVVLDLGGAYLPAAWLGAQVARALIPTLDA